MHCIVNMGENVALTSCQTFFHRVEVLSRWKCSDGLRRFKNIFDATAVNAVVVLEVGLVVFAPAMTISYKPH